MDDKNNIKQETEIPKVTVIARNLDTSEVIYQSANGEEVIRKAEESGEEYILDFKSELSHNFLF